MNKADSISLSFILIGFILVSGLASSVLLLVHRLFTKRTVTFDKGRGILEVKKSLLVPAKVTVLSLPGLIGVCYVGTSISIQHGLLGEEKIKVRKLVMLTRNDGSYESTVLYTIRGLLDHQDMAIAREVGEFLETKAIVKGTVSSDAEASRGFSGKDLGPEIKVEDFSKA